MKQYRPPFVVVKILLALLPALVFWQTYSWMTLNSYPGLALPILWALMVWNVWSFSEKNDILERHFRLTEIAFFLLPLSAIIFSFVFGAEAVSSTNDGLEQAGAAIGSAIGGTFIVLIALIIGVVCGIIMHLVTSRYSRSAEKAKQKQPESLSARHGIILSLVMIAVLAITLGSISAAQKAQQLAGQAQELRDSLQQAGQPTADASPSTAPSAAATSPAAETVALEIVKKGFQAMDFMAGIPEDQILLDLKFINRTGKGLQGVAGVITFYDIFDNEILSSEISYDEGIAADGKKCGTRA